MRYHMETLYQWLSAYVGWLHAFSSDSDRQSTDLQRDALLEQVSMPAICTRIVPPVPRMIGLAWLSDPGSDAWANALRER